jgi:hypothetical protein
MTKTLNIINPHFIVCDGQIYNTINECLIYGLEQWQTYQSIVQHSLENVMINRNIPFKLRALLLKLLDNNHFTRITAQRALGIITKAEIPIVKMYIPSLVSFSAYFVQLLNMNYTASQYYLKRVQKNLKNAMYLPILHSISIADSKMEFVIKYGNNVEKTCVLLIKILTSMEFLQLENYTLTVFQMIERILNIVQGKIILLRQFPNEQEIQQTNQ